MIASFQPGGSFVSLALLPVPALFSAAATPIV